MEILRLAAVAKNATIGPLAGIESATLRFRCSPLTNLRSGSILQIIA